MFNHSATTTIFFNTDIAVNINYKIIINFLVSPQSAAAEDEAPPLPPLYLTEFVLEPNQLLFTPNEEEYQEGLSEVIKRFQQCVLSVKNLVPDDYFDAFTRSVLKV